MNTMIEIYDRIMGVVEEVIFATAETAAPTLTVGETLESAANVKCNGNVHGYNLLTPVTIAFATAAEAASVAVAKK